MHKEKDIESVSSEQATKRWSKRDEHTALFGIIFIFEYGFVRHIAFNTGIFASVQRIQRPEWEFHFLHIYFIQTYFTELQNIYT